MQKIARIETRNSTIKCEKDIYPVAGHFMKMNHLVFTLKYIGIEKEFVKESGRF